MAMIFAIILGLCLPGAFSYVNITEFGEKSFRFNLYQDWMIDLSSNLYLSQITMPGTHDTMARYGGAMAECQNLPLMDQLLYGIRFLDIRCRHIDNLCAIHHGPVFQNAFLGDVLDTVVTFLQRYPSEVVIVRLKEEYDPSNNSRTLVETIQWYVDTYRSFIWNGGNVIPRLSEVRGKIVIYDQIAGGLFGINWNRCLACIQDEYQVDTVLPGDINKKWNYINSHLTRTNGDTNTNNFYINFLSGASTGAYPNAVADRINVMFMEKFRTDSLNYRNIGAIMMDFPVSEEITLIIDLNFMSVSAHLWLYEDSSYNGERKMFSIRPNYCITLGHWDDISSSLQTSGKCVRIYDKLSCNGCYLQVNGNYGTLGAWNDRITSISNC